MVFQSKNIIEWSNMASRTVYIGLALCTIQAFFSSNSQNGPGSKIATAQQPL